MFELAADLVSGGWDALSNITSGIGSGVSRIGSTFFPAPQRTTVVSEITQAAGGQGQTFRPTLPSATSIWETNKMDIMGWLNTPYEDQFAIPIKVAESKALDEGVSGFAAGEQAGIPGMFADIMDFLGSAAEKATEIKTVVGDLAGVFGLRGSIFEGPVETGNSRGTVQHENDQTYVGANVVEIFKTMGGAIADQVKGLFSLGFPQNEAQPAIGIRHEIQPSKGLSMGLVVGIGAILLVLYLTRKK